MFKTYDLSKADDVLELCNVAICKEYELKYEIERTLTKFEVNHDIKEAMLKLEKLYFDKDNARREINKLSLMYDTMTK